MTDLAQLTEEMVSTVKAELKMRIDFTTATTVEVEPIFQNITQRLVNLFYKKCNDEVIAKELTLVVMDAALNEIEKEH